jgi:dUTP pyrophosphatase
MKVYIAGPMSGLPESNYPAFNHAADRLRAAGFTPLNPAILSDGRELTPVEYEQILNQSTQMLLQADAVCVLPGHESSTGATLELAIARQKGIHKVGPIEMFIGRPPVPVRWTGDPECAPRRHYDGDAGWDLIVAKPARIPIGGFYDVSMGIQIELPHGAWALVTGRSSALRKRGLLVSNGIIDNGYRGDIFAGCQNLSDKVVEIEPGERIAQLIPFMLEAPRMVLEQVDELTPTDRGTNGFGSTGK